MSLAACTCTEATVLARPTLTMPSARPRMEPLDTNGPWAGWGSEPSSQSWASGKRKDSHKLLLMVSCPSYYHLKAQFPHTPPGGVQGRHQPLGTLNWEIHSSQAPLELLFLTTTNAQGCHPSHSGWQHRCPRKRG